ncbi:glutamate-rich protein 1 [Ctenopharyngodon idella]|uniref:glutamate-rich protein 1 n=1 Tax=Ctenopharyngodon idella TaxID=7959 RepID=UPI002230D929|nr:glutamate-rich protein 1 [Ctenopharyngodon idella]XP_051725377.1 glutamate-rich protein 1 [Ctenopharyngodon idella]
MSVRKEVFQSKVLQRLYPAAQKQSVLQHVPQEQSTPVPPIERPQSIPTKKSGNEKSTAVQVKKLYTVLPPPEGYLIPSGNDPVTLSNPDSIDSDNSPVDTDDHVLHKRKRRRKKKVSSITTAKVSTPPAEGAVQGQTNVHPSDEGDAGSSMNTERLSKNRKRKMKKKRHKEKLIALGLVPHVRAVEFTYAQSGHGNLEEVLDLLRTTQEIYLSDRKSSGSCEGSSYLPAAEALFSRLSGGTLPPAEISRLCGLRALLLNNEEQLKSQLQEFRDTSILPADEVSVVCTLIEYWLTEILPIQREQKT